MAYNLKRFIPLYQPVIMKRFYNNKIINHYENPRNIGSLNKNDDNVDASTSIKSANIPHVIMPTKQKLPSSVFSNTLNKIIPKIKRTLSE